MIKYIILLFCLFGLIKPLFSQSLFESALSSEKSDEKGFYINGYVRSNVFANETDIRSIFGEASLKLETSPFKYGNAFAEIRFRQDFIDSESGPEFDFREGYVNLYLGKFDFRIGQQIIVWGRADGFNPTNNLTSYDYTAFSPDEDDKRLSNFVVSTTYNLQPFSLNINWVPVYKNSVLPFENAELPGGVTWGENKFPDYKLEKSNYAFKINIEKASFDASLSYFNGYHKLSGLSIRQTDSINFQMLLKAHRTQVIGFDFSTVISNYGLRGEFALSSPENKVKIESCIPNKQFEYTLGLDREWGNFNLIAQYIGKYVFDFESIPDTIRSLYSELNMWNRMIFNQQNEISHSASLRPSLSLLHQTLSCEILSLYNFTTEELFVKPQVSYKLSDNISLTAGVQYYYGIDNTLYKILGKGLNTAFVECKVSF